MPSKKDHRFEFGTRTLIFGSPGRSMLGWTERTIDEWEGSSPDPFYVIVADPSDAQIGPVGAVSLARRQCGEWNLVAIEGLATLDAARFRGPLSVAVGRLVSRIEKGFLWVVLPGLVRGIASQELPAMIAQAMAANLLIANRLIANRPSAIGQPAFHLGIDVVMIDEAGDRRADLQKLEQRRKSWAELMQDSRQRRLDLAKIKVWGLVPPVDRPEAWHRKMVVLHDARGGTLGLGVVERVEGSEVRLRTNHRSDDEVCGVCIRDSVVTSDGLPITVDGPNGLAAKQRKRARHQAQGRGFNLPSTFDSTDRLEIPPIGSKGEIVCDLVNGVFGDSLLHTRLVNQKRSLLFDIGEAAGLHRRIAHQVSDVFITHAHIDHIAGLSWLIRMRVGKSDPCRVFGPKGIAKQIWNQINVFTWNLVGDDGPCFVVTEVHHEKGNTFEVKAGKESIIPLSEQPLCSGVVLQDRELRVRAATVNHHIPVLAYRLEQKGSLAVRNDQLMKMGVAPGPWVGALKRAALCGNLDVGLELPDGSRTIAGELARQLLEPVRGHVLSYVTDMADEPKNIEAVLDLIADSDVLLCEAGFLEEDRDRANRTAHLTARACGRLADAASARVLVPFHVSARYVGREAAVYEEIGQEFSGTIIRHQVSDSAVHTGC